MKSITILLLHMQHGGIEKQTITFANQLAKKYKVNIISTYSMNAEPAYPVDSNINIKYLIDDKPNREEFKSAIRKKNLLEIFKQGFKALKILYLKNRLMINEIKQLDCDFILSTRIEFADMLSKFAPRRVVKITQEHLHDDSDKYIKRVKKAFSNLDYLVVLCDGSKNNYSSWLADNKKIKIVEIPNILEYIPEYSASLEGNNLISVGRLHSVKDFETLIRVFNLVRQNLPDATLTIVGDGEERNKLQNLTCELDIQNEVKFTGMLSKEEVEKHMMESDLYVMTSLTECFPMVLLEASSVGLPLVAFDVPVGPKAIIENDYNGFLIEERKIPYMADTVCRILQDRKNLKKLGKNSKFNAAQYLPENIMTKWFELFDK